MKPSRVLPPASALMLTLLLLPILVSPDTPPLQCAYPCSLPTPPGAGGSAGYSPPAYPGGGGSGGSGVNSYPPPNPGSGGVGGGTGGSTPYFPPPIYPGGQGQGQGQAQGQGQVPQQPPNKIMPYFPYYFRNAAALRFQAPARLGGAASSAAVLLLLMWGNL